MDKSVLHDITYGMYVLSSQSNGKKAGCIINTFCQITSNDLIVSASVNKQNYTNKIIKESKRFALSIISEKTNNELIKKFGFFSSENTDKFQDFNFQTIEGVPVILEETTGYLICEVINVIDCGTHDIFLAKVIKANKNNDNAPMTYSYYHKVIKGRAPKNAPTFIEEQTEVSTEKKYKCMLCGYIYDDAKQPVKFQTLGEDWTCPVCGVQKSMFKEIK